MSRRSGQNGTVELRGGVWRGRFLVDVAGQAARQKRSVWLGLQKEMTKSEARAELKRSIHAEGINARSYVIPKAESLSEVVEQWEMTYLAKRKPSTQATMHYHLGKYLLPKWGKVPVDCITGSAVNAWIGGLSHLSPITIRGIVKTLQIVLGRSLSGISYPSKIEVSADPRCYTEEEIQLLLSVAKDQYQVLFRLAADSGARAGELFALTVDDILVERRTIRINKAMYRQQVQTPKSRNATRWVVVSSEVIVAIYEHLRGRTSGLVFMSRRGTPLNKDVVNQKHLYPLLKRLNLPKGGMHGFRHYRVSQLVMAGVSKDVIKNQIGHGSDDMIRRYTHFRAGFIERELERVNFAQIDPIDPAVQVVM